MVFTKEFAVNLENHRNQLSFAGDVRLNLVREIDQSFWSFLKASEYQLIQLMNDPATLDPNAAENVEFGWCLFFLNGLMPDVPRQVQSSILGVDGIRDTLKNQWGMPDSTLDAVQWEQWQRQIEGAGVLKGDGSLASTARYALLDPGWVLSLLNFISVKLHIRKIAPFNSNSNVIQIPARKTLRIALFGDWGTGPYQDGNLPASPSQQIMQQIHNQAPDIAIHLGDVYYSGTDGEEHRKLINSWNYRAPLGNFTLNSNHEMYYGGQGLFNIALNPVHTSLFRTQGESTFFSIHFGNWLILGLDSAYYASQSTMYMDGAITDQAQRKLLQEAGKSGKRIMILTHHNPLTELGDKLKGLWTDVVSALTKEPDYWYWGHVHNGIVYSETSAAGSVKCRCQGNGSIPIGNAVWFEKKTDISFYTNASLGDTNPRNALRVKNGFALLEFDQDAVNEHWYYQDGSPAWSSSFVRA